MKDVLRTSPLKGLCIVMLLCVFAVAGFAQSTTFGAIGGTVMDKTKAVIPNAKVTVTNTGTGAVSSTESDSFGSFRVVNLDPGTYTVSVQASSFAAYKATGVVVEVGRITQLEAALAPAGQAESVEVSSEIPTVNTIQQDFSSNINQTAINNLPINGRRWSNFALLTPGANPDGNFGLISFRGISGLLNNNTVDGGDNNQAFFSEERGRTRISYTVSQSSIREFQVNTSNYSAEYGRAAGGVVNSVTKSGTNNIHGEGFYYIRDNTLGATNPFTTRTISNGSGGWQTVPFKPEDRRHQFGGSVGGPIVKDKLFFFFTYDGQRRNFPGVAQATSPSAFFAPITVSNPALAGKTCSQTSGSSAINEGQMLYCKGLTQAQADEGLAFFVAETGQVARKGNQDILFPKLDWKLNAKNTVTVSYNRMRWNSPAGVQTQPTVPYATNSFGNDGVKTDMLNARLNSTITDFVTNEFRYQWGRDFEFQSSQPPSAPEAAYGLDTSYGGRPPYITVSNGVNMGRANFLERIAYPDERRNQFANTTNIVKGHHLIKFGFDMDQNHDKLDNLYNGGGTFAYSGTYARAYFITDLINNKNGAPTANYGSYSQAFGPTSIEFSTWDYAVFLQDDWKILPRLTVSAGVRYEYESMPKQQYPNSNLPQTLRIPGDYNNIGPRIGFAWDVFGDGKTAVRGGYGIYYGRINNGAIGQMLFANGTTAAQLNYTGILNTVGPKFPNVWTTVPSGLTAKPNGFYFDPGIQNPQIHQADLILEREVMKNTVLSVNYIMSLGRELPNFYDMNVKPTTATQTYNFVGGPFDGQSVSVPFYYQRINTSVYSTIIDERSDVNSNYNALVVQLNRRMNNGLQFMTNYTWSKALDTGQNSQTQSASTAQVYDPYNNHLEYGRSNFDIRHKFVGSVVWQPQYFNNSGKAVKAILNGWGLAPLVTIASGRPFTDYISGNGVYTGIVNCSPAVPVPPAKQTCSYQSGLGGINGSNGVYRLGAMLGRNSFSFPTFANVDMRISRTFKMPYKEGHSVEFLAEAFNLFNHQLVTQMNNQMYSISTPSNSNSCTTFDANGICIVKNTGVTNTLNYTTNFNTPSQAGSNVFRERQVQFAVRYSF